MKMSYALVAVVILIITACASGDYHYGTGRAAIDAPLSPAMKQQYIVGQPNAFLDSSDWIWPGSWLSKLFLWNSKVDSHEISAETLIYAKDYIWVNELDDVQVLVNAYSPGNQWSRLVHNKTVGAGWRYTLGVLSVTFYTIFPGRFFGGDNYNSYTNTINLYSDDISIALHEAGHAKYTGTREYKGTHAAIYALPLAPLYYEAKASNDAISYLQDNGMAEEQKEAYKTLHPAYGTYLFGGLFPTVPEAAMLGAIPGHVTGNIAASNVDDEKKE